MSNKSMVPEDFRGFYTLDENEQPVPVTMIPRDQTRHLGDDMVLGFRVSTVFLGIDHGYDTNLSPVLWETMIFNGDEGLDLYCARYDSAQAAREGHKHAMNVAGKTRTKIEKYVSD